jgi:hypothetical protein
MAAWRAGSGSGFGNATVDVTLRLDNAQALPICPHLQLAA